MNYQSEQNTHSFVLNCNFSRDVSRDCGIFAFIQFCSLLFHIILFIRKQKNDLSATWNSSNVNKYFYQIQMSQFLHIVTNQNLTEATPFLPHSVWTALFFLYQGKNLKKKYLKNFNLRDIYHRRRTE